MSTKIYEVKMTDSSDTNNVTSTYNVSAETLLGAIQAAAILEQNLVDGINAADANTKDFVKLDPDVPRSVELLCYVNG